MWDNNIVSTAYPTNKNQNIDHTLSNRVLLNPFQHNTVDSTTINILPSVVKNKNTKTKSEDMNLPSKSRTYTAPYHHNPIVY